MTRRAAKTTQRGGSGGPEALIRSARACREAGQLGEAEALLRRAVGLAPQSAPAQTNHGLLLSELGRHHEAVAAQRRAVALAPRMAPAWLNLSMALQLAGDAAGAEQARQQACSLDPDAPETQVAAGLSAQAGGRLTEATAAFRAALQGQRTLVEGWINLGLALHDAGDAPGCRQALDEALRLRPDDRRAWSDLLMTSHYHPALSSADLRALAAGAARAWPSLRPRPSPRPGRSGPLRVGYLSGDLRAHPVGWLLGPVLHAHRPSVVEVHVFDHRPADADTDPAARDLRAAVQHWHAVDRLDDRQLAQRIADCGIDVLVDLSGHTDGARLGVLAWRPAPVQLCWLGWFGSTGVPAVDAVVLGDGVAPPGAEAAFTEAIERVGVLHFAYAPPPWAPVPGPPPSMAQGHVTFGCFNNPAKMGDAVVQLWAQLLQRVPGSRLLLKWKTFADPGFVAHTRQRFAAHGVDAQRLDLRPASPHPQMLAEYGDVDIALDPFPFSGLTSTLEALWMGVPVLTLPQQRCVSRQTLAVLQALGLDAWAAPTPRRFLDVAQALAADAAARQALRADGVPSLRSRMRASALMQASGLAHALEAMYERRLQDCGAVAA